MPLRIRIEPDGRSKEMHARQLMKKVAKAIDNQPVVEKLDDAMIMGNCEECYNQMWRTIRGVPALCDTCEGERQEEKKQQSLMTRVMSAVKNDGMAQH